MEEIAFTLLFFFSSHKCDRVPAAHIWLFLLPQKVICPRVQFGYELVSPVRFVAYSHKISVNSDGIIHVFAISIFLTVVS